MNDSNIYRNSGPPSHSHLLAFADLDPSYMSRSQADHTIYKDEEASKLFNDKFNLSLLDQSTRRPTADRSYAYLNTSQKDIHTLSRADKSQILNLNKSLGNFMVVEEDEKSDDSTSVKNNQRKVKDVSQINDITGLIQSNNTMLLGSEVSGFNEPTLLGDRNSSE